MVQKISRIACGFENMTRHNQNTRLLLVTSLVLLVSTGCLEDEAFESCAFPPEAAAQCVETGGGSQKSNNCIIEHPQCADSYCVSYWGSSPFCSSPCETDADCPSSGTCVEFALQCEIPGDTSSCLHLCVLSSAIK